jgi:hypothetical protein
MSNRTAKFVSAIFASLLAGTALTTVAHGATPAADDCLSGPKGALPQGGHWYYRIDRATKRHCWYIGDEKEKVSRAAPGNSSSASSISPPEQTATQQSIADARAELPSPQTRVEQDTNVATGQRIPAMAPNAWSTENNQPANAGDATAQTSVIASRWPDSSGVGSSVSPGPTADNSDADAPSDSAAPSTPADAAIPLAAADASPSANQSGSIQMLLIVMVGALALAGLIGSAIFRFGSWRRTGLREIRVDRRAIWDSVDSDRPLPYLHTRAPMPRVDIPRERRGADDPNGRIEEMLAQLARGPAR